MTEVGIEYLDKDGETGFWWVGIIDDPDPEAQDLNHLVKKNFEAMFAQRLKFGRKHGTIYRKIKRNVGEIEYFDD